MKKLFFIALVVTNVYASNYLTFFSPETDLIKVIVSTIERAEKSVDVSIYSFDSTTVRDALERKLDQGIPVRILIRPSTIKRTLEFVEPLKLKGAEVRYLTKTNHHKFIIVDNKILLNSSGNFSDSKRAASYDENLIVCMYCYSLLSPFREEFRYLYRHATDLHAKRSLESPIPEMPMGHQYSGAFMTSQNFEPFYKERSKRFHFHNIRSGMGNVEEMLIDEIDRASFKIQVATGHLRSWKLYKALRRAAKRGVTVDLLLDSQEYVSTHKEKYQIAKVKECKKTQSDSYCRSRGLYYGRKAMQAGINVYIKYYSFIWDFLFSPQMHHKYMIIDDSKLFTGSYNWSTNAEFNSFENLAIIEEYSVINDFQKNFQDILDLGNENFENLLEELKSAQGDLPLQFEPLTLPMKKVDQLYRVACSKCPSVFCRTDVAMDDLEEYEEDPAVQQYLFKSGKDNYCRIH